ncbi:hypothetical protein [Sphingomonas sp. SUN039]|uniref:hypothetical protein n=1 Tax=Sphingomonas sp. SUN039 TaxID=2937787 RepID=UPI002164E9E4|nr:hypothetical protein [Sphingomonas sp. SUN039]UVO55703.1 hypothetical protein M0209_16875 [Sphingomonas sp. SUN039]
MHALSPAQLLDLSERGRSLGMASRAALVIGVARPDLAATAIHALRLGEAGRLLLELRAATFAGPLSTSQPCPACGTAIEFDLECDELLDRFSGTSDPAAPALQLTDLIAVEVEGEYDPDRIRHLLLARIAGESDDDLAALSAALEAADPDADIQCEVNCPSCGTDQLLLFDPATFLWGEIAAQVPRILREVAELARAFHWSERDILAMSSQRRAHYLGMVQ